MRRVLRRDPESGSNTFLTGTIGGMSSSFIRPSAMNARNEAPRTPARTGRSTCRILRPVTSAWIWHQISELAPPPMNASDSNSLWQNFSTASRSHLEL